MFYGYDVNNVINARNYFPPLNITNISFMCVSLNFQTDFIGYVCSLSSSVFLQEKKHLIHLLWSVFAVLVYLCLNCLWDFHNSLSVFRAEYCRYSTLTHLHYTYTSIVLSKKFLYFIPNLIKRNHRGNTLYSMLITETFFLFIP